MLDQLAIEVVVTGYFCAVFLKGKCGSFDGRVGAGSFS